MSTPILRALVHAMRHEAEGVVSVELRPVAGGADFPAFEAGAHLDLHLPNGLVRSYSLVNPVTDRGRYVVGVLNDRNSRGGSRYVHRQLRIGTALPISVPRNHFKLHEAAARTVLVAGGIGITPIFCMLQRLAALRRPVEVLYCARSRREAAFAAEIACFAGGDIGLGWHFDDEQGAPPDLRRLLAGRANDTHFYCCGPGPMLGAFEHACEELGYGNVHVERFAAGPRPVSRDAANYTVELKRSGKTLQVMAGKSLLDTLLDAGLHPEHSCREGVCGACETRVLAGEVEHRDGILTQAERAANKSMMICVSQCRVGPLVLDL